MVSIILRPDNSFYFAFGKKENNRKHDRPRNNHKQNKNANINMCIEKNKCSLYNTEVQPSLLDTDNVLNKLQFIAINYVPITSNSKKRCSNT